LFFKEIENNYFDFADLFNFTGMAESKPTSNGNGLPYSKSNSKEQVRVARKLSEENLKVVWAEFSTLSSSDLQF
jgi:hypothetical protein